jgi:SAM-dependent methyltransferase
MSRKTATDLHWNERALSVEDDAEVNVIDVFQREIEYDYVCRYLKSDMSVLEVGCGNGFSTDRFRGLVKHVDAFDYSENMIERAKARFGETNNRFFQDNVLAPEHLTEAYDLIVCIRVLINLKTLDEQRLAVRNLVPRLRVGGRFILVEGFTDGFTALNRLRKEVKLPPLEVAKINFYSALGEILPELERELEVEETFHLGAYDYLTRVVYPMMVGADEVKHNTVFGEKCAALARAYNPDSLAEFSRVRGVVLERQKGQARGGVGRVGERI